jgi:cAMP-dependent protein kinase regulator
VSLVFGACFVFWEHNKGFVFGWLVVRLFSGIFGFFVCVDGSGLVFLRKKEVEQRMADADPNAPPAHLRRGRRKAVSAPSDVKETQLEEGWEPKVYPKTEEESARISNVMDHNILFKYLDEKERKIILNAMFQVDKKVEDEVIKQGDEGDNFYVIDSGTAHIFKDGALVLVCKDGDSFGELALMYDAPRAATVIAKSEMKLWAMDRLTYKHILMDTTLKRRDAHKEFLTNKVPILQSLDPYERLKVADLSEAQTFKKGETVFEQGAEGDSFYVIEKGTVACIQKADDGSGCVALLAEGDYFGERAILKKEPRACTCEAASDVEVLVLDESSFHMVLGPVEESLNKKINDYKSYAQLKEAGNLPEYNP